MLRVPMITLSIFSLRIFLMFVIQLNSSLDLVLELVTLVPQDILGKTPQYLYNYPLLRPDLFVNL